MYGVHSVYIQNIKNVNVRYVEMLSTAEVERQIKQKISDVHIASYNLYMP